MQDPVLLILFPGDELAAELNLAGGIVAPLQLGLLRVECELAENLILAILAYGYSDCHVIEVIFHIHILPFLQDTDDCFVVTLRSIVVIWANITIIRNYASIIYGYVEVRSHCFS